MPKDKVSIQFPDNSEVTPSKFQQATKERFDKIDNLLLAVVASVLISGVGVVVSVVGIFIDQLRYNNAAYTEYANKSQNVSDIQKANKDLLQQINNQQEIIIDQQKRLDKLNGQ